MANSFVRKRASTKTTPPRDAGPEEIARALDASAADLAEGRTEEIDGFLRRMEARLERCFDPRKPDLDAH